MRKSAKEVEQHSSALRAATQKLEQRQQAYDERIDDAKAAAVEALQHCIDYLEVSRRTGLARGTVETLASEIREKYDPSVLDEVRQQYVEARDRLSEAQEERHRLIVQAAEAGIRTADLARLTGMPWRSVWRIIKQVREREQ